jgi:plasmid maintenance system antidote protein VapI
MHCDVHQPGCKVLSEQIREAIADSGMSRYRIARTIGVDESGLCKFCRGTRGLSMDVIDRLGELLQLEIRPRMKGQNEKG